MGRQRRVDSGVHGVSGISNARAVGDHKALEAPLLSEQICQNRRIGPGGDHRPRARLFDYRPKGRKPDFVETAIFKRLLIRLGGQDFPETQ